MPICYLHHYSKKYVFFGKQIKKLQCKNVVIISLRSGIVMKNSNLLFQYWMICMDNEFFGIRNAAYVYHKRYEPIWFMHKIHRVMSVLD
jgi:hypothetical protein